MDPRPSESRFDYSVASAPLCCCSIKMVTSAKSGTGSWAALATGMCRLLSQHFLLLRPLVGPPKLPQRQDEVPPSLILKELQVCKFYLVYKTMYCKKHNGQGIFGH